MISPYLKILHAWLESRKLDRENKLSAEKSGTTVFRTRSKKSKFEPHLTINISAIPVKSKFKVLGVIFDSMLNFGENVRSTKEIITIAGSDWGCTKETLSVTYKAISRSVLHYGAPISSSKISKMASKVSTDTRFIPS